ncbi:3-keto sterol reductase [Moniliophthora roreri]|nr:3-keto sterol reductase [Moniliophthora roreri]
MITGFVFSEGSIIKGIANEDTGRLPDISHSCPSEPLTFHASLAPLHANSELEILGGILLCSSMHDSVDIQPCIPSSSLPILDPIHLPCHSLNVKHMSFSLLSLIIANSVGQEDVEHSSKSLPAA